LTRLRILLFFGALALLAPQAAFARGNFDPTTEFEQHEWIPIHLGPLDLSINKTVAYLILGTIVTIALGLFLMRARIGPKNEVGRRQAVGEIVYDIAQTQVAEQGLPHKAIAGWFPYVASLMLFIWVINMIGFIPLPLSNERFTVPGTSLELPTLAIYAATSSISVTLALALMTWTFTHIEGIRYNGPVKYFKSWIPDVPKAILPLIVPLEILGQFMRLISLSVRLYANMLAGHMLILTFIGLIFLVIPGLVAFAVDFSTGAIYYPPASYGPPPAYGPMSQNPIQRADLVEVQVPKEELTQAKIEEVVSRRTGKPVTLKPGQYRAAEISDLDEFGDQAERLADPNGDAPPTAVRLR
jgi:F-type H+-transporting ATPase subunit a